MSERSEQLRKIAAGLNSGYSIPLELAANELERLERIVQFPSHVQYVQALKDNDHLRTANAALEKATGLCDKHKPDGGARNCLVCGCEQLTFALDKISYICGEPNEHGLSEYGNHYDEETVLKQAEQKLKHIAELSLANGVLRSALEKIKSSLYEWYESNQPHPKYIDEAIKQSKQALSTTPSELYEKVVAGLRYYSKAETLEGNTFSPETRLVDIGKVARELLTLLSHNSGKKE